MSADGCPSEVTNSSHVWARPEESYREPPHTVIHSAEMDRCRVRKGRGREAQRLSASDKRLVPVTRAAQARGTCVLPSNRYPLTLRVCPAGCANRSARCRRRNDVESLPRLAVGSAIVKAQALVVVKGVES